MDIQEVRIDIPDESGWGVVLHPSVAPTVLCTGQDAMLLGPGDRHIEQSALFFEFAHRVRTHRRREDILLKTHHEHRRELQTLGRVDRHQRHLVVRITVIAVKVCQQCHLLQEVGQIHLVTLILFPPTLHEVLHTTQELLEVLLSGDILRITSRIDLLADA